jgi:arginyl-tRNA synthetase
LAKSLNLFYEKFPVIKAKDKKEKESRLNLVFGAKEILKTGLNLLGINALEEM